MAFPKAYSPDRPKTFGEHLLELRYRLFVSGFFLIIGTIIGYLFHQTFLQILITPLNSPVFYSSPAGGLDFLVKSSLLFGFLFSLPIFTYNILRFFEPVFSKKSTKRLFMMLLFSCLMLFIGIAFAYFVSLPAALGFLSGFATENVQALISAEEYFAFVARYLLGFGILFQLPLFLLALNSSYVIATKQLLSYEKWVVLFSFVFAAFLTPTPDFFNQLIMAIPIILLYQLSIVLLWIVNKKDRT